MLKSNGQAREIVFELLQEKDWRPRFNIVASCGELPAEIRDAVLRSAFGDKSKRVREKAADVALRRRLAEYAPLIQELCDAEDDPKLKRMYAFCLDYLRQGYRIEERPNGKVSLGVLTAEGIRLAVCDKSEIAGEKLGEMIEKIRNYG